MPTTSWSSNFVLFGLLLSKCRPLAGGGMNPSITLPQYFMVLHGTFFTVSNILWGGKFCSSLIVLFSFILKPYLEVDEIVDKDTCYKAWPTEFDLLNTHGGKRIDSLKFSSDVHAHTHTHAHAHTTHTNIINCFKILYFIKKPIFC